MAPMRMVTPLLLALAASGGCVTVHSHTNPRADLGSYRTFAWQPASTRRDVTFERSLGGEVVRARVAHALAARGIRETREQPSFLVAYRTQFEQRSGVGAWGYPAYFWGPPGPVTIDEYSEGELIIDFVDARSGEIFWTGTAAAVLDERQQPDMHRLTSVVDKMMKRYPTAVASAAPRRTM